MTPWTVAHQAPLSMGFFRQEHWSGFPCPPPGDLPDPGMEPVLLCLLHWQVGSLPLMSPGKLGHCIITIKKVFIKKKKKGSTPTPHPQWRTLFFCDFTKYSLLEELDMDGGRARVLVYPNSQVRGNDNKRTTEMASFWKDVLLVEKDHTHRKIAGDD